MEKLPRSLILRATPFFFLLLLSLIYTVEIGSHVPSNIWTKNNATGGANHLEVKASLPQIMKRLVKGYSQTQLEATGFACHSDVHTKVCVSNKPVTIDTGTMKVYAPLSQAMAHQANRTISPYPRREDKTAMELVSSVHILRGKIHPPPACDCTHDVPAVVFSSGGFTGDIFHEFNEVIIPLFLTSRHFQSRLRFIVTDFKPQFIAKFSKVLSHLSSYELINPAANGSVHCFPGVVVGLHYHDNLAIKATDVPKGYSMLDFKQFLRDSYNLKIRDLSRMKRPVLVLISRPKPRMFLNQNQMVTMMTLLGFRVVLAKPDMMANVDKFAKVLNLCSVLVGAHDAALTTEIFLPEGAVMVQVVGLGLEWASATYYGGPAAEMGLNYIEYKIEPEESSLISVYGRDDPVITNPESIASKGYTVGRSVYFEGQNFNISIARFRKTLVQALGLLGRSA
ncbi:alpha-1,3-arabinosyltransferase XAT3-like [Rhododendron vialii]|uniref:alpha-1,3-arabinosyltransferase XAT3-like n=1 Tax=Rhododendron vialii TaxID=182163 RepID=UPI00265F7DE6|nr:alpha-1,3-arabinosyltransferase XAT3-like [Rhododendron vialii]